MIFIALLVAGAAAAQLQGPRVIRGVSGAEYQVDRRSIEIVADPSGATTFLVVRFRVDDLGNTTKLKALAEDVRTSLQSEAERVSLDHLAILAIIPNTFGIAYFERRYGFVFIRGSDGKWAAHNPSAKGS